MNVEVWPSEAGAHQRACKGALRGKWGWSQGRGPEARGSRRPRWSEGRGGGREDTGMDMGLEEVSRGRRRGRTKWGFLTQGGREGQEVQVLERQLMHQDSEKLLPLRCGGQ